MRSVPFTPEMRKEYTILIPNMLPIHWNFVVRIFSFYGYNVEFIDSTDRAIIDEGLRSVHNDTCYPALLVIGQYLYALRCGKYDPHKVAMLYFQTGGGCRASNYICLMRKALDRAGFDYVPILSINFSGWKNEGGGFKITLPMLPRAMSALAYGDLLMLLRNQTAPYEIHKGDSDKLVEKWTEYLCEEFNHGRQLYDSSIKKTMDKISAEFEAIERDTKPRVKVGIVGEIYIKYSALGNNNLERFLASEDCEVMVPGLLDFMLYCVQGGIEAYDLYGGEKMPLYVCRIARRYLEGVKSKIISAASAHGFTPPSSFTHLTKLVDGIISRGCDMGEGWLLTAEMAELYELGYENIICVQPFGCLPNHIVGKGMIRKLREKYPRANIVPIDYDPGATAVNQENRIKLMLAVAREHLAQLQSPLSSQPRTDASGQTDNADACVGSDR